MNKIFKYCFVLTLSFFMACTEGDDGPDDPTPEPTPTPEKKKTGVFTDSEVGGLKYETETKSGVTNSAGEYEYLEGETVTFYVGDIKLGSGPATGEMSPVSIASSEGATIATPEVKNMAAFLQTLDSDGDPSNGILIETAVAEAVPYSEIDFTAAVVEIIGNTVAEVSRATGKELQPVYPEEAAAHLAQTLGVSYEAEDLLFTNFIPVMESWVTSNQPYTSVRWIHETDDSGKIIKSTRYSKRPYQPLASYEYEDYNEAGLPGSMQLNVYSQGVLNRTTKRDIIYNADNEVIGIQDYSEDGNTTYTINFTSFDEESRITEAKFYYPDGNFAWRETYKIDEQGNSYERMRYSTESGNNTANLLMSFYYDYTAFGEVAHMRVGYPDKENEDWEYIYREDMTLQERIRSSIDQNGNNRTDHYYYDQNEKRERIVITVGDYVSDYVAFYENGDPKIVETYYKDFLYEIIEYNEDGSSIWKTINEETGAYKLEYKDAEGKVTKTENYNSNGELISTTP
ncbi:MAG: hypothetical protein WBL27_11645 [Salinimicrobium sp.]